MAKLETLTDSYPSLDTGKWNVIATSAVTGGRMRQTPASQNNYSIVESQSLYQLDESYALVEVYSLGAGWTNSNETILRIYQTNGSNDMQAWVGGSTLYFRIRTSGTAVHSWNVAYSSTDHRWWRIREVSGTTYFDTSPNGTTWTNRTSAATPAWVGTTDTCKVRMQTGWFSTGSAGSPAYSEWDNFNVPPSSGKPVKVWNGSAWVDRKAAVKVWNGSAWVAKTLKVYNGSAWV